MNSSELMELAGNMLERYESKDTNGPRVLEATMLNQHGMVTVSGLNDYDYQNLSSLSHGNKQLNQVQTVSKVPIPPEILEHFKHIKCHCMMGLFPEIGRAWLTIDSDIYIWTYEQGRDVAYYDGLNHLIVSVGLIKPKLNVFINDVEYLLVLTTPVEIVVLGVVFCEPKEPISSPFRNTRNTITFREMQLMSKPIFVIGTDHVAINVVHGSNDGRIFLGARDGCLYEITYQAESTWFGKRWKKINHSQGIVSFMMPRLFKMFSEAEQIIQIVIDDSRDLLYVLTDTGSLEAWTISENASAYRIAKATRTEINDSAINVAKTIETGVFTQIKSICALSINDSSHLHLLAVTQSGVRLYFSTGPLNVAAIQKLQAQTLLNTSTPGTSGISGITTPGVGVSSPPSPISETSLPKGLYLVHVRMPPGYTPNTTINKPKLIHSAHYSEGTMLLISTSPQEQDILWSISSAPFPNRPYLAESASTLTLDGTVWSLAEVRERSIATLESVLRRAQDPKKMVFLTNQGVHIIALLKPGDILQQLLLACQGAHHEAVKRFFQAQTEKEACITSLFVACSAQNRGTNLAMWAAQAFMMYGGEPCFIQQQQQPGPGIMNYMMSPNKPNATVTSPNVVHRGSNIAGPSTMGQIDPHSPQMFMSTPMPNAPFSPIANRTLQPTSVSLQHNTTQYPLSPIGVREQDPINPYMNQSIGCTPTGAPLTSEIIPHTLLTYSAKHDGLYLYMVRMLQPIWHLPCVSTKLESTLSQADCNIILEDLYGIRSFLEVNSVNDLSTSIRPFNNQTNMTCNVFGQSSQGMQRNSALQLQDQHNALELAQSNEKQSLMALNCFIKHTCEVLALWKILCEHPFRSFINQLDDESQGNLIASTFRDLILTRTELCASLIVALINSYLKDYASVSPISLKLREICPNLYRHEDAIVFKATEILMSSKNCTIAREKEEKMNTALQLCRDAAPNLPLQNICQQFTLAGCYSAVVELSITCAAKLDPEEIGIHFYHSNEPPEDREGYAAYASRMSCYKEIRLTLDYIYQTICNNNSDLDFTQQVDITATAIGRSSSNQMGSWNNNNGENNDKLSSNGGTAEILKIISLAMQTKDPLLHISIYEWLMKHNMFTELLAIVETTLGEYLRRSVLRNPENLQLSDLLWKYYEKNEQHAQAARILEKLANTPIKAVTLEQRIDYLSRAVLCMRNDTNGYSAANGSLLQELQDKLEIAHVQKTVLDAVNDLKSINAAAINASDELNCALYDISNLYQNFADPFDLWECKLMMLHCSHHNDTLLIESVWSHIISKCVDGSGTKLERSAQLFAKIESLAKEFGASGHCFPLAFLIRELELKACQLRLQEGVVPEKLNSMNIDNELLMEYYSRMISMNERVWANEGNEWHLVQSSIRLITLLTNNVGNIWSRNKRRIVGKAQDMISVCLNLCYQKPGTEYLQQPLKELQCRLQRSLA